MPTDFVNQSLIAFSTDGRALFLQNLLTNSDGITKVEFGPTRRSVLRGSTGMGRIWFLTEAPDSAKILVSGFSGRRRECGAFEIDTKTGAIHALHVGTFPECAGAVGPVSPDGKRTLDAQGEHVNLLDLETGAIQSLGSAGKASWSPDGRWIAVSSRGRISLIDAMNTSTRKNLGASGSDDHLVWSPDSKRLLIRTFEAECRPTIFFGSLTSIDVETGRRRAIASSHCMVSRSTVGWVDPDVVR